MSHNADTFSVAMASNLLACGCPNNILAADVETSRLQHEILFSNHRLQPLKMRRLHHRRVRGRFTTFPDRTYTVDFAVLFASDPFRMSSMENSHWHLKHHHLVIHLSDRADPSD